MPRRAPAPSPGLGAKRAALAVTGVLSLLLVLALIARATATPPVAPPPKIELDEPAELARAEVLVAAGHRLAVLGRDKMRSDRERARAALVEALTTFERAATLYGAILARHPGEGFEYVAVRLDRLNLEKLATRKLLLELG